MEQGTTTTKPDKSTIDCVFDGDAIADEREKEKSLKISETFQKVKTGDEAALDDLVRSFDGIVNEQVKLYIDKAQDPQDLIQEGWAIVVEIILQTLNDERIDPVQVSDYLSTKIKSKIASALNEYSEAFFDVPVKRLDRISAVVDESRQARVEISTLRQSEETLRAEIYTLYDKARETESKLRKSSATKSRDETDSALIHDEYEMIRLNEKVDEIILRRRPTLHSFRTAKHEMSFASKLASSVGIGDGIPHKSELDELDGELAGAKEEQQKSLRLMRIKWGYQFQSRPVVHLVKPAIPASSRNMDALHKQSIAVNHIGIAASWQQIYSISKKLRTIVPMDYIYPKRQREITGSKAYINSADEPLNIDRLSGSEFNRLRTDSPEDDVANRSLYDELIPIIDSLPEVEATVIKLRYFGPNGFDPSTLKAIGDVVGKKASRVRGIEQTALGRLRRHKQMSKFRKLVKEL